MDEHQHQRSVPLFFIVMALVVFFGLCGVAGTGMWWANIVEDRREDVCHRTVLEQDNNRAMWLWLADYVRKPDNQDAIADMLHELDKRLPVLKCEGNSAVPVKGDS